MAECHDCDAPDVGAAVLLKSKGNGVCSHCHGTKISPDFGDNVDAIIDQQDDPCSNCNGTGQCQSCGGTGVVGDSDSEEDGDGW